MAAVPIIISPAVIYDKWNRQIFEGLTVMGMAQIAGLGVGGGPIYPPPESGGGDHIWGGGNVPMPSPPIANVPGAPGYRPPGDPPGIWGGGNEPFPTPPIYFPPQLPPGVKPPESPPPGTVTPVPPPEGSGGWPVQPITAPAYVVFNYPGYGPVYVTAPAAPAPAPSAPAPAGRRS